MFDNDPFDYEGDQFVISKNLLSLMRWLLDHEEESLKRIIARSVKNGFLNDSQARALEGTEERFEADAEAHNNVLDFLILLEALLLESIDEYNESKALENRLSPVIDQIDESMLDTVTLHNSIEKAANHMANNPDSNPQRILLRELLRRWSPSKKEVH